MNTHTTARALSAALAATAMLTLTDGAR